MSKSGWAWAKDPYLCQYSGFGSLSNTCGCARGEIGKAERSSELHVLIIAPEPWISGGAMACVAMAIFVIFSIYGINDALWLLCIVFRS